MEYLLLSIALCIAILILITNNITYAALGLLSATICSGCVCFCHNAPFVGIIQMLICTTTTLLLLLFSSMFRIEKILKINKLYVLLPIVFYILITFFLNKIIPYTNDYPITKNLDLTESNTFQLGKEISLNYPWAFEFIGVIITVILVAIVGICNRIEKETKINNQS